MITDYLRILVAEVFLFSIAFFTWNLVRRLAPLPLSLRWCAWGVLVQFWLTIAFHGLRALHAFTLYGAGAVALLSILLGLCLAGPTGIWNVAGQGNLVWRWIRRSAKREKLMLLLLPLICTQLVVAFVRPPIGYDFQTYHGVKAALWVQHPESFEFAAPGGWSLYHHLTAQGSIVTAWMMLLFHSDRLVSAASVLFWPFFCLCVYALAREFRLNSRSSWLMAWFISSLPAVLYMKAQVYVDLPMHADIICSVAFAMYGFRQQKTSLLGFQGMAVGLAAATKITALSVAGILMASPLLLYGRKMDWKLWLQRWGVAIVLCALPIIPWMLYTYLSTGYPFSPLPISVAGLQLGQASPDMHWYLETPVIFHRPVWLENIWVFGQMFYSISNWMLGLFIVPFLLLAPWGLYRLSRINWRAAVLLTLLTLAFVSFYLNGSFKMVRLLYAYSDGRFFLSLLAWSALLGFLCLKRYRKTVELLMAGVVAWELIRFAVADWSPNALHELPLVLAGMAFVGWFFHRFSPSTPRLRQLAIWLILVPATLLCLGRLNDALRLEYFANQVGWMDDFPQILPVIDRPPRAYRIAVTSGPIQLSNRDLYYPFFGRELQNQVLYIPISLDGGIIPDSDPDRLEEANYAAWLERLQKQNVDFVMTFSPRSIEMDWMDDHPEIFTRIPTAPSLRAENLGSDSRLNWGLYRVNLARISSGL